MSLPEHRFTYEDLLSGNFSLPRMLFNKIGGFNAIFPCREDYELGARLIKSGIDFYFVKDAMAYHRDTVTDLDRSLVRKREEGRGDVMFGRCHQDLIFQLNLSHFGDAISWRRKTLLNLVFRFPGLFDGIAFGLRSLLQFFEHFRMRGHWQRLYNRLLMYWYIRGLRDEFHNYHAFLNFLEDNRIQKSTKRNKLIIDLKKGLLEAEKSLDLNRPDSLFLCWAGIPVGYLSYQPGAERIRSPHLRYVLKTTFAYRLIQSMAIDLAYHEGEHRVDDARDIIKVKFQGMNYGEDKAI